jgi:hypothetical protein
MEAHKTTALKTLCLHGGTTFTLAVGLDLTGTLADCYKCNCVKATASTVLNELPE